MPSTKQRIVIYLEDDNFVRLQVMAQRPGEDRSSVANKALAAFFMGEHEVKRDAALIRRLDKMTRQTAVLKRNQEGIADAIALFVRYFLTVIPPLPDADKETAQAQGAIRFERYLDSLKTIVADGDQALLNAIQDVKLDETAYFTESELKRLHDPAPEKEPVNA